MIQQTKPGRNQQHYPDNVPTNKIFVHFILFCRDIDDEFLMLILECRRKKGCHRDELLLQCDAHTGTADPKIPCLEGSCASSHCSNIQASKFPHKRLIFFVSDGSKLRCAWKILTGTRSDTVLLLRTSSNCWSPPHMRVLQLCERQ